LTEAIEVRAERVLGEVLLPQVGGQKMDVEGGMGIDALEHADEIAIGIDALEAARREQALNDAHVLRAHVGSAEEPMAPAQGNSPNLPFQMIGIWRDIGIRQKHFERDFPLQGVPGGLGEGIGGEQGLRREGLLEPAKELHDLRFRLCYKSVVFRYDSLA
jgi:hypothetical protein